MSPSPPFENVLPANADTLLEFSALGGQLLYQGRALNQSLEWISGASQLARTVNAVLTDLSNPAFRKYQSTITCSDVNTFPGDYIYPGLEGVMDCAVGLCYWTAAKPGPSRAIVPHSYYEENGFSFYRPQLYVRVRDLKQTFDEWKCINGWSLEVEEI